jgi:hypothetical protein
MPAAVANDRQCSGPPSPLDGLVTLSPCAHCGSYSASVSLAVPPQPHSQAKLYR